MDERAAAAGDDAGLVLTGERTLPGIPHENYWYRRHEAAYRWAAGLAGGRVLDAGCGEGYGAALLAAAGHQVLAVDLDAATVRHARRRYGAAGVGTVRANLAALPVATAAVDTVVALQVVEHLWHPVDFLAGCRRVLARDGRIVLSTPNRLTFAPGQARSADVFHAHEYAPGELHVLLAAAGLRVLWSGAMRPAGRLRHLEARLPAGSLPATLSAAGDPAGWPADLHDLVATVTVADFEVTDQAREAGLDLLVVAAG